MPILKPTFVFSFAICLAFQTAGMSQSHQESGTKELNATESDTVKSDNVDTDTQPGLRYLALGDSYTIGELVDESDRWPVQLAKELNAAGIVVASPEIIAKSGWTTDELNSAIDEAQPHSNYDFVTLLIGVNNQYRGRPVDNYAEEFADLLDRAILFAGGQSDRVLVVSIPDYGITPFVKEKEKDSKKIARELNAYNKTARQISRGKKVPFVNITPVSRKRGLEPAMIAEDNLHPSGKMYAEWTKLILPVARKLLQPAASAK